MVCIGVSFWVLAWKRNLFTYSFSWPEDIKGIALPQSSDKLYSASGDGALRIWDCHTGQCVHEINLQAEAGSLISEGPWVFLGLPNAVKVSLWHSKLRTFICFLNTILWNSVGFVLTLVSSFCCNILQAFNVQTCKDLHLNGSVGRQVNAIAIGNGMLFAGTSVSLLTYSISTSFSSLLSRYFIQI